ncbi:hypothetical protein D3C87_1244050 [compost metagenome]
MGDLKSQLGYKKPSEVLALYERQLRFRILDPKQDFLHELNLGSLSLRAGQTQKSRAHLKKAASMIDWQNYTSVLNETSKVLFLKTLEERYKLQPQEYLTLHYLFAISYIMDNEWSEALVSVRAIHENLNRIKIELNQKPVKNLAFYYWFAGFVYEQNQMWEDARIDFTQVKSLNPLYPKIDLHLWRTYAMTGDAKNEERFANILGIGTLTKSARLARAKEPLKILLLESIGGPALIDFKMGDVHLEKTRNGKSDFWGLDQEATSLSQVEIDREISGLVPKKMDNPAYLLHVNPYSITYMVFGEVFSAYWESLSNQEPSFIVNSFEFIPTSIGVIYMNDCERDQATCKFTTYSGADLNSRILTRKNLSLVQLLNGSKSLPFQ